MTSANMGRNTHSTGGGGGRQEQETPISSDLHSIAVSVAVCIGCVVKGHPGRICLLPIGLYVRSCSAVLRSVRPGGSGAGLDGTSRWYCSCSGFFPGYIPSFKSVLSGVARGLSAMKRRMSVAFCQATHIRATY